MATFNNTNHKIFLVKEDHSVEKKRNKKGELNKLGIMIT